MPRPPLGAPRQPHQPCDVLLISQPLHYNQTTSHTGQLPLDAPNTTRQRGRGSGEQPRVAQSPTETLCVQGRQRGRVSLPAFR